MKCPKCSRRIAFEATSHPACGWNVANGDASVQKPACAYEGCPHPAILSRKLPTGWANLCKAHDLALVQAEADAFSAAQGLVTVAQKRAWIREKMKGFGKIDPAEHWQRVLATPDLPELSYRTAREALKNLAAPSPE